ncbi:hypothetical protein MM300_11435 [Evansella sp. LMS18]|uniref:hypothetical protein n=1 Tax=Evansella sp. LMS18 TaxID=2924033 RepID=UPI0020D0A726|nr:hypothetical protein [Evansella sp. LMS18]UTR12843.1 hypothetical protein MM300_11435 [Evansella sp. LMS18]
MEKRGFILECSESILEIRVPILKIRAPILENSQPIPEKRGLIFQTGITIKRNTSRWSAATWDV